MPCGAPCDWVPCNQRCKKTLPCGCQCPSLCGEACPDPRFCQNHGSKNVLNQEVDYIEFNKYQDADLDVDPVLVLSCGHIFTRSTLDGLMDMSKYYELDEDGLPTAVKESNTLDFSKDELKCCPDCRGTLRNVARYGRIVRRALLDESTKKFICWSNAEYIPLANQLMEEQDALSKSQEKAKLVDRNMRLVGDRNSQVVAVRRKQGTKRYGSIFATRRLILEFVNKVRQAEQPFQRVRDMVEAVRRRKAEDTPITPFDFDQSLLQTRAFLLGSALLLRCDMTILTDEIAVRANTPIIPDAPDDFEVEMTENRHDCQELIDQAIKSSNKLHEVEGHISWARFAVSSGEDGVTVDGEIESPMDRLRNQAFAHLDAAETICAAFAGSTSSVSHEIEPTRKMLRDGVFYSPVSTEEMRAVVAAMAKEFHGTGYWYYCVNGHPFTIGECGGPMQESRCPQCGVTVGGRHHQAAEGVRRAHDIEEQFCRMRI